MNGPGQPIWTDRDDDGDQVMVDDKADVWFRGASSGQWIEYPGMASRDALRTKALRAIAAELADFRAVSRGRL